MRKCPICKEKNLELLYFTEGVSNRRAGMVFMFHQCKNCNITFHGWSKLETIQDQEGRIS